MINKFDLMCPQKWIFCFPISAVQRFINIAFITPLVSTPLLSKSLLAGFLDTFKIFDRIVFFSIGSEIFANSTLLYATFLLPPLTRRWIMTDLSRTGSLGYLSISYFRLDLEDFFLPPVSFRLERFSTDFLIQLNVHKTLLRGFYQRKIILSCSLFYE